MKYKQFFYSFKIFFQSISLPFQLASLTSLVLAIYFTGIGIRDNLFFSFDQSRDALESYSIWHDHHIKILGPGTDINGVFHGVFWYYALAIAYAIKNQPEFVAIFFSIFLFISAAVVGILAQKLFKNAYTTIIAFILYILSPLFLMSTHWLSNPILSFMVIPYILLFLWNYLEKQSTYALFFVGVTMGILIQGEFAYAILLICFLIYWYLFRIHIKIKHFFAFVFGLLIILSSFIIAELKFHFQGVIGAISFITHAGHGGFSLQLIIVNFLQRMTDFISTTVFAFPNVVVLFLLGVFCLFVANHFTGQNRRPLLFLIIWLCGLFFFQFFSSGISSSYFLFYPFLPSAIILVAFILDKVFGNKIILFTVLCFLVFCQIQLSRSYLAKNYLIFTVQQGSILPYEKEIIAYTYESAQGKSFTINAVTNPLYIYTTWAYLYTHYGLSKYGYLPYWGGRSQVGILGMLPEKQFGTELRFLIFEPNEGIPDVFIAKITYEENKISDVLEEKHIGKFIIQKRKLNLKKVPPVPPEILLHSAVLYE